MNELIFRNRQRVRRIHRPLLRKVTCSLLQDFCGVDNYELCIHLVAAKEMARLNKEFLQHEGSTDVITFDHSDPRPKTPDPRPKLTGEIYLCLDDAIKQARQFRTSWQSEVVRYVIHGVLHLLGHDDLNPAARKIMKRGENRFLRELTRRFPITSLAKPSPQRANRK